MKTVRHWPKGVTFDAALAYLFYPTRIDVADGKYTIIYDFATGQSECLHHGAPWRSLVGDKLVLACFDEIVELRRARLSLLESSLCDLRRIDGLIAEVNTLKKRLECLTVGWGEQRIAKLEAQRDFLCEIMCFVSEALIFGSRDDLDLADQLTSAITNVKEEL